MNPDHIDVLEQWGIRIASLVDSEEYDPLIGGNTFLPTSGESDAFRALGESYPGVSLQLTRLLGQSNEHLARLAKRPIEQALLTATGNFFDSLRLLSEIIEVSVQVVRENENQ